MKKNILFLATIITLVSCSKSDPITLISSDEINWASTSKTLNNNVFLKNTDNVLFEYTGINKITDLDAEEIHFYVNNAKDKDSVEMIMLFSKTYPDISQLNQEKIKIEKALGKFSLEKQCLEEGSNKTITKYWTTKNDEHVFFIEYPNPKKYKYLMILYKNPTAQTYKQTFEANLKLLKTCN